VALVCLLAVVGCGDTQDFVVTPPSSSGPVVNQRFVFAQLSLGSLRVPGVSIRLENLDGSVIAEDTANADGIADFQNLAVPDQFRAVTRIGSQEFVRLARNFHSNPSVLDIDVLSTLQSSFQASRPDLTPEQADQELRRLLSLPPTLDLGAGLREPNSLFSGLAFLRFAQAQGGLEGFGQTLQQGESGPYVFSLTNEVLLTPFSGPDAELNARLEDVRLHLAQRVFGDRPPLTYHPGSPAVPLGQDLLLGPSSLVGQFALGVATGVTGNLLDTGAKGVLGWASKQMGGNFGEGNQLAEISATLADVLTVVTGIQTTINTDVLQAQYTNLQTVLLPVSEDTSSLQTTTSQTTITNEPFVAPPSVSNLISALSSANYETILQTVQQGMVGSGELVANSMALNLTTQLGIDQPSNMNYSPWMAKTVQTPTMAYLNNFASQQVMALNLYAEQAHNSTFSPDPVTGIQSFLPNMRTAFSSLKQQYQQVPLLLDGDLTLVDLENGVMWLSDIYGPATWSYAQSYANSARPNLVLADGTTIQYSDGRLPTVGEGLSLQDRGRFNPNKDSSIPNGGSNAYPDAAQATSGLPGLGFDFINTPGTSNNDTLGNNGEIWMYYYFSASSPTSNQALQTDHTFVLNDDNNITNGYDEDSRTFPYIMCRTLGNQMTNSNVSDAGAITPIYAGNSNNTESARNPVPAEITGQAFSAAECATFGILTSISDLAAVPGPSSLTFPGQNGNPATTLTLPENCLQLTATLGYTVNLGGAFTSGVGTTGSTTNPTLSQTETISTTSNANTANGFINGRLAQIVDWVSSSPADCEVLNTPGLDGIVIPHTTNPVQLTARFLRSDGTMVSQTITYTPTAVSPRTLESLQISPRNEIYGLSNTQPARGQYRIYCTGFYADRTVASLADEVTFTASPADAVADAGLTFVTSGNGVALSLNPQPDPTQTPYNINVTATMGAITDTMEVQIVPPDPIDPNTFPVINGVTPSFGSTAGGYFVVLKGVRLGGTLSVLVDDVSVPFVQNTNNEVTISMPPHAAGVVDIILTNNVTQAAPVKFSYTD
jgi:hypothetical protein